MFHRILLSALGGFGAALLLLGLVPICSSAMRPHFVGLLARSWLAMVRATGTTTLGFVVWTVALALVGWASGVISTWLDLKKSRTPAPLLEALSKSIWPAGAIYSGGVALLVLATFTVFVILTIYEDHQTLVADNKKLMAANQQLAVDLDWRKHNVSTSDPVFGNLIYLLQAFNIYRHHASPEDTCVIRFTAMPDSAALASTVAQLSNSVSGCFTFGPGLGNPDEDEAAASEMVPGKIVFHAERDDVAADQLFNSLGNQIQMKRSYKPLPKAITNFSVPSKGKVRVIWLQFGTAVTWNSELYRERK